MSLETWKKEFYCEEIGKTVLQSLENCLLKYEGVLSKNLKKHNVRILSNGDSGIVDRDNDFLYFDDNTCSLCRRYFLICEKCPLNISGNNCELDDSPYVSFWKKRDPKPMIKILKKLIKERKEKKGKRK